MLYVSSYWFWKVIESDDMTMPGTRTPEVLWAKNQEHSNGRNLLFVSAMTPTQRLLNFSNVRYE